MHDAPDLVDSYLDLINLPWQNIKKKKKKKKTKTKQNKTKQNKVKEEKAYILHVGQGHLSLTRYLRKSYMALWPYLLLFFS